MFTMGTSERQADQRVKTAVIAEVKPELKGISSAYAKPRKRFKFLQAIRHQGTSPEENDQQIFKIHTILKKGKKQFIN